MSITILNDHGEHHNISNARVTIENGKVTDVRPLSYDPYQEFPNDP